MSEQELITKIKHCSEGVQRGMEAGFLISPACHSCSREQRQFCTHKWPEYREKAAKASFVTGEKKNGE